MFAVGDTAILFSKQPVPETKKYRQSTNETAWAFHPVGGYLIFDINDMYNADGSLNNTINRQFYFPITQKFKDLTRLDEVQMYSSRNAMIIRLAEIYLIAAEAAMELGNGDNAYDYLKTLADARSYLGNGSALLSSYGVNLGSDIDIDFILDERARELAAEQLRWFDLKRTGSLVLRVQQYNPDDDENIQPYHLLRPLPQYLLDEGYTQNPGYVK